MIDALKSKVTHYYTSWNFWKIRDWSGHDNSNVGFDINVMFKYLRNESWIHVQLKKRGYSVFECSWFRYCVMIDQSVNMHTSLQLVRIWGSMTPLFRLPSLPYTEIPSLLTEFTVLMHSIHILDPSGLSENLCANIILDLRIFYLHTPSQKGSWDVKQGLSALW
jgi:hypothetical protein